MSRLRKLIISFAVLLIAACGGSDEFALVFVSDFSVDPGTSRVGDQASVVVVFSSSSRSAFGVSSSARATDVALLLPRGVDFVTKSSELDIGSGGFDPRSPTSVSPCQDGSNAVLFKFSGSELSTFGENRLRLKVMPTEPLGSVTLLAEADETIGQPCGIAGESSDVLTISPD